MGEFGPYVAPFKLLRLDDGDTLTVYRVKAWKFSDGSPPALQIEYALPRGSPDSVAVRQLTIKIWPTFRPYVEQLKFSKAIITGTRIERLSGGIGAKTTLRHYSRTADRDSAGQWRLADDGVLNSTPANQTSVSSSEAGTDVKR